MRVVTSQRAGMGKSLYIKRRVEALDKLVTTDGPHEVIVSIHGPSVTPNTIVGALKEHMGISQPIIFHFDIAHAPCVSGNVLCCSIMYSNVQCTCIVSCISIFFCNVQVLWQVNTILFCLLVLQGLCDNHGNVWRCHPAHLYMIESTIPKVRNYTHVHIHTYTLVHVQLLI